MDRYGLRLDVGQDYLAKIAEENLAYATRRLKSDRAAALRTAKRALVLVDVQNDFCEGGALAVAGGSEVVAEANELRRRVRWDLVVRTQDFHPPSHVSFASNNPGAKPFETRTLEGIGEQVMWPDHCVQGSQGAEFHPYLDLAEDDVVVQKGKNARVDSYSGFGDAQGGSIEKTELEEVLRAAQIEEVFVCGLATDYCVGFTCLDARKAGFSTFFLQDASRGIAAQSIEERIAEMEKAGVTVCPAWREALPTADEE